MFLGLKEMRRAKVRFGLLIGAVALLVFLILFQQTIQNGLLTSFVGALRSQSAPVLVYSVDGRRNLQGSVISVELQQAVEAVNGVGRAARIGQSTFSAQAGGKPQATAIIGYEVDGLGSPTTLAKGRLPTGPGEGVASESDADNGYDVGDIVTIEPGGLSIAIVGLARNANINVTPTLFTTYATYERAVAASNPDARPPLPSAIGVEPAAGVSDAELVERINAASDQLDALTRSDAADKAPGVSQVRSSFLIIFGLYGLVVPFVTALFFLIITFQKANSLTLLRAIGAPARRLVSSLLVQVVLVVGGGVALGTLLYTPLSFQRIGGIPLRFEPAAVVGWAIALLLLGVLSALFSAYRVFRIQPVDATTRAGVGR
jgi:putative ABC transport system permease protein